MERLPSLAELEARLEHALRGRPPQGLSQFFAVQGGRFGSVIFADDQGLVGKEGTAATAVESHRIGINGVDLRRGRERKLVTALLTPAEVIADQIRSRGISGAARWRPEFRQGSCITAVLGVELHLCGVQRADRRDRRSLLGVHAGPAQFRQGDRNDDQNDRYYDQQLDQGKATALFEIPHTCTYIL